jgi:SET domain
MDSEPGGVAVRSSVVQGLGVFAQRSFTADELIRQVNVVREITKQAPLRPDLGERHEHCAYPDGKVVLYGFPDRHFNHSCDPNAYECHGGGEISVRARRAIAAGEEITLDYNINLAGGDTWPCHCGAARCRRETLGSYFRLPLAIQLEYLPLLADWFVARHRERIAVIVAACGCPSRTARGGSVTEG